MWTDTAAQIGQKAFAFTSLLFHPKLSKPTPPTYARLGSLEVRLAQGKKEIKKAQKLRYHVFYKEGGAIADAKTDLTRRDQDKFDKYCDHLIVIDHATRSKHGKVKQKIVGTYRLLTSDKAKIAGSFYSATQYELEPFIRQHQELKILELGRSCVLPDYRRKRTIELLWLGLLGYIREHKIDVMIGCASFSGVRPLAHAEALSYLAHFVAADDRWNVKARQELYKPMALLSPDQIDVKKARDNLPPLIKGYLRVGARFGDGAVVDLKFNTTDVFVIMPVAEMNTRYIQYFGSQLSLAT